MYEYLLSESASNMSTAAYCNQSFDSARLFQMRTINSLCAIFSEGTKHIFTFHVIPGHWHATGSWNPSSSKTGTCIFYIVDIVCADALATPAAIILTMWNRINSFPVNIYYAEAGYFDACNLRFDNLGVNFSIRAAKIFNCHLSITFVNVYCSFEYIDVYMGKMPCGTHHKKYAYGQRFAIYCDSYVMAIYLSG